MGQLDELLAQMREQDTLRQEGESGAATEGSIPDRLVQVLGAMGRQAFSPASNPVSPAARVDPQLAGAEQVSRTIGTQENQQPGELPLGLAAGVAKGLLTNPVTRRLARGPIDMVAGEQGQSPEAAVEGVTGGLESRFGEDKGFRFGEFLGEEGPYFVGSLKAAQGARTLVELAVEKAGPRIAAIANSGRVGTLVREAKKLDAYLSGTSSTMLGQFLRRPEPAPLIYRAAQGVGNVAGFTAYEGLDTGLDHRSEDDVGTVSSSMMKAAGYVAAAEVLIVSGAAAFSRFGRRVNMAEALTNFQKRIAEPELVQVERRAQRSRFNDSVDELSKQRVALEHRRNVAETVREFESQISSRVARKPLGVTKSGKPRTTVLEKVEKKLATVQERVVEAQVESARAENALKAWNEGWVFYPENAAALNRTLPVNPPDNVWRRLQKWLLETRGPIAKSPQDFAGKLGLTGVRFTGALGRSEADAVTGGARQIDYTLKALERAATLTGTQAKDGMFLREAVDMFVKGKDGELIAKYGQGLFDHLDEVQRYAEAQYDRLVAIGARPKLTEEQLGKLGLKRYWPQVLEDIDDDVFQGRLLDYMKRQVAHERPGLDAQEVDRLAQLRRNDFNKFADPGLHGHGSFDQGRYLPGSTDDKIAAGLPFIADPMRAMESYLGALERKHAYGSRWGYKGELADAAVSLVGAEGGVGAEAIARQISDIFFNRKPAEMAARRLAEYVTTAQVATKMVFSGLVNVGQMTHAVAINGMENTARGLVDLGRREGLARLNHQVNLAQGLFKGLRDVTLGGHEGSNWLNRFVDFELRMVGFTPGERANRLVTGAGFGHLIHDTLGQAVTGRLRGVNLETARRLFSSKLDTDLDMLVRRLRLGDRLTPEEFDRMVYRGTQLGQFMPDLTRRPAGWNTPTGRVVSQFNHFVLSQTHFIRNEVLGEAARGNWAPLASLMALYPTGGELIAEALNWVKERERPRKQPWRMIDQVSLLGALGQVTSLSQAAWYGRLAEGLLGPTLGGTAVPAAESVAKAVGGDLGPAVRQFERLPIVRAGTRALDVTDWTLDHFEEFQSLAEEGSPAGASVDSLRMQRSTAKGGPRPQLGVNVFQRPRPKY